jgi:uncharacterized membrane protein (DUF485 family)
MNIYIGANKAKKARLAADAIYTLCILYIYFIYLRITLYSRTFLYTSTFLNTTFIPYAPFLSLFLSLWVHIRLRKLD